MVPSGYPLPAHGYDIITSLYVRCILDISEGQETAVEPSQESWQQVPVAGSSSGTALLGHLGDLSTGYGIPGSGHDTKITIPLPAGYVRLVTAFLWEWLQAHIRRSVDSKVISVDTHTEKADNVSLDLRAGLRPSELEQGTLQAHHGTFSGDE